MTGTLTFTRWAAICAPITPAPSTATFFTWKRLMRGPFSLLADTAARSLWSFFIACPCASLHPRPRLRAPERPERAAHVQALAAVHRRQAQPVVAAVLGVED